MSEIEAQNRRRFYVYSSWIPVIPAGILRNSWNSAEFLDSGRNPRNPAGISGGMESIELYQRLHQPYKGKQLLCKATAPQIFVISYHQACCEMARAGKVGLNPECIFEPLGRKIGCSERIKSVLLNAIAHQSMIQC